MKHHCSEQRPWGRRWPRGPLLHTDPPWDKVRPCHSQGAPLALIGASTSIKPTAPKGIQDLRHRLHQKQSLPGAARLQEPSLHGTAAAS